jgi:hypothetical protein
MSAGYTRRGLLQHQYSTDDVLKTSGIKSPSIGCAEWRASNARLTSNVRTVECRVDTGHHRNPAVAYWLKPRRGDARGSKVEGAAQQSRPGTAALHRSERSVGETPPRAAPEPLHIVYVSPQWHAASTKPVLKVLSSETVSSASPMTTPRILNVPWKTTNVRFADGTTTTTLAAHQHLYFSNPAPHVDDISLPLSDVTVDQVPTPADDDEADSPRALQSAVSLSPSASQLGGSVNPSSQGRRSKSRRHRNTIQTAADLLADVVTSEVKRGKKGILLNQRNSADDDTQLLANFGAPRSNRWQTAVVDASATL